MAESSFDLGFMAYGGFSAYSGNLDIKYLKPTDTH